MKKSISLLLLAFLAVSQLFAANYYASPNGTGDGGSHATPGNVAVGASMLSSVDTLYLLAGQYDFDAKISIAVSGTAIKNKVIAACPGEQVILDFRNQPYGKEITGSDNVGISISEGVQYLHFKGFVVRYAGKVGILNQGMNCIIENCVVYGCGDTGIQMKKGGNNLIKNCDSYNNFDYKTLTSTGGVNYGGNADGFADKQYATAAAVNNAPNTYEGCRAWNNADDGWDFYERIGSSVLTECIAYQNGPKFFDMSNHPRRLGVDSTWFKAYEGAGQSVVDRYGADVTLTVSNYVNWGNGNGFKQGGNYTAHHIYLNRCLAVGNSSNGFDKNNNAGNMYVYNGTSYKNNVNYGFGNPAFGNLTIKNSLSLEGNASDYFDVISLASEHNSWNTVGVSCEAADFVSVDTTLILTARNADGSLANTNFMKLADGSDLIDAGIDAKLAYSGTAPDLGCYEKGVIDQYPGVVSEPINKNQTILSGSAISNIVFTWSGAATALVLNGTLPVGITQTVDNTAKTLTLSGTVTDVSNSYNYTISTLGGTAIADVVTGTIVVKVISKPTNATQVVMKNTAVAAITYSWVGDATSLLVSGLPTGLVTSVDPIAKSLIISGTTTASEGPYTYTVTTDGGTGNVETVSAVITVISPFNLTKYYNIYTYGIAANSSVAIATTNHTKRFITASAGTVLMVDGTSDAQETANAVPDPVRAQQAAQWIIADGTTQGYITVKNRVTGEYLQLASSLSATAIELNPVYKKDDNGFRAYAIYSADNTKCMQVNPPTINTFTGYADRTRMRWIFAEAEDIVSGIRTAELKSNFLKYTLVDEEIELIQAEDFVSVEIISISGAKVMSTEVSASSISLAGLSSGVYLVKGLSTSGEIYLTKIIKK